MRVDLTTLRALAGSWRTAAGPVDDESGDHGWHGGADDQLRHCADALDAALDALGQAPASSIDAAVELAVDQARRVRAALNGDRPPLPERVRHAAGGVVVNVSPPPTCRCIGGGHAHHGGRLR